MNNIPKLFKVNLINNTSYYVISCDLSSAYQNVRKYLDENDLYFRCDRELLSVELVAVNHKHADTKYLLLIDGQITNSDSIEYCLD